jgi:hypothetical protein
MPRSPTPEQQQRRIDELTESVNILGGQVAALMVYVARMMPIPAPESVRQFQGDAQAIASTGHIAQTNPKLSASQTVERLAALAVQLQTPPLPEGSRRSTEGKED